MLKWIAVFDWSLREETIRNGDALGISVVEADTNLRDRFRTAANTGHIQSRRIASMWLVDLASAHEDVIATYGVVPELIKATARAISSRQPLI